MKIRALVGLAGIKLNLAPGQVADLPEDEAMWLIRAGSAEAVKPAPENTRKRRQSEVRNK